MALAVRRTGWPTETVGAEAAAACYIALQGGTMEADIATRSDLDVLTALNRDYIHSVQHGDVRRFNEILADDFLCSSPDGSLIDKKEFLAQIARPATISGLEAEDVQVRILGNVAIIHARTSYTTADGERRNGRYTDVWARRDGRWLAVSAHVTR
jgi:ketosteroid isomerase-like protein